MDPVSAFGLACNVIAVVETSCKIVAGARQAYANKGGITGPVTDFLHLPDNLKEFNDQLTKKQEEFHAAHHDTIEDAELWKLCRKCSKTAEEITKITNKLNQFQLLTGDDETRRRDRMRVAVRTVWRKDELDALEKRLQSYQAQFDTGLMASAWQHVRNIELKQAQAAHQLDKSTKEIIEEIHASRRADQEQSDISTKAIMRYFQGEFDKLSRFQQQQLLATSPDSLPPSYSRANSFFPSPPLSPPVTTPLNGSVESLKKSAGPGDIFEEIEAGDLRTVRKFLRRFPDAVTEYKESTGMTCLHYACALKQEDIALCLLHHGARVSAEDDEGKTALHYASKTDMAALLRAAVQMDTSQVDVKDDYGRTPRSYAPHGSESEFILKHGHKFTDRDAQGKTVLGYFAARGNLDTVTSLLARDIDLSITDNDGSTALHDAAENGHAAIVEAICKKDKSQLDVRDSENRTALLRAAEKGHIEVVRHLLENGARTKEDDGDDNALTQAARNGHTEIARLLLESGIDPDHRGNGSYPALSIAAINGHLDIVTAILDHGAEVNAVTDRGWSALHEACENDNPEIVQVLLDKGADPNLGTANCEEEDGDEKLWLPISVAIMSGGNEEPIRLLIKHPQFDPNRRNIDAWTALHEAVAHGHPRIVEMLLEAGVPLDEVTTDSGCTALVFAIERDYTDIMAMMINAGASLDAWSPNTRARAARAAGEKDFDLLGRVLTLPPDGED